MIPPNVDLEYRLRMTACLFCGVIGLTSIVGEIVCRLLRVEGPTSLSTLVGVAIGALAAAVAGPHLNPRDDQSHPISDPLRYNPPQPPTPTPPIP